MTATGGGPGMPTGVQSSGSLAATGTKTNVSANPAGRGYFCGATLNPSSVGVATLTVTDHGNADVVLDVWTAPQGAVLPFVFDYTRPIPFIGPLQYTLTGNGTCTVRFA